MSDGADGLFSPTMAAEFLDQVYADLTRRPETLDAALAALSWYLRAQRRKLATPQWQHIVTLCLDHPLRQVLHQDPLTARAFSMSRGYQGDAELLDIIYGGDYKGFSADPVSALGAAVFSHTIRCQAPTAVRERRTYLASQIDRQCARLASSHILSVACGHMRELELSKSVQSRAFGRFAGLDQDPVTVNFVQNTWGQLGVECKRESVKGLLTDDSPTESFDYIYSAGLYDYLEEPVAQGLTRKLFRMLRPRGRLLIGNYTPNTVDVGYMEAYMGWNLLYRDASAMQNLAAMIPASSIGNREVFSDTTGAVIYLSLEAQ